MVFLGKKRVLTVMMGSSQSVQKLDMKQQQYHLQFGISFESLLFLQFFFQKFICLVELQSDKISIVIKLMLNSSFNHSFYHEQQPTNPSDLIYDQVYKNASSKNKYSRNPKYTYYNTLLNMKQKLSEQQAPVYNNLFNKLPKKSSAFHIQNETSGQKTLMPIYHVQKINKMKFKVYKHGAAQFVQRVPVTDLSFQIKIKGDIDGQFQNHNNKPRLEQILNEYRKMNSTHRGSKSRGTQMRRSSISHSDNMSLKWMKNTVERIGKNTTTQRK